MKNIRSVLNSLYQFNLYRFIFYFAPFFFISLENNDKHLIEEIKCKKLKINLENGTQCELYEYKAFWCKKQCYIWDITQNNFSRLVGLDKYTLCSDLNLSSNHGLSKEEQCLR